MEPGEGQNELGGAGWSWVHGLVMPIVLADLLYKVRTNRTILKSLLKSFKMALNSKHKSKNQGYRKTKNQSTEKQKPSFIK